PQSVAWPQNLQLYRHKTGAKPGDKDFDVTDSGVWQTLAQKHGADFDAIIFNNPHAGFGQHKFQALGLTKGMLVTRMQAETIWYGGTMEVFREILKDLGEDFAFSKSGSLTDYATGTKYSFSELFQEVEGGYIAKRSIMGLNEFILSKFKFYGAQLLRAGGTLEVNMPANTATKIGAMGFVQTGFNWTTSPYYADYTSELTDQTYHPSFHETFQRTGPPRPATIGSMRRFVFTKQ
ncbi:MAG TPA: hypothetical protein DCZ10_01330, partial [Pelotomaculum sp.]|nr:hypothetical protein [Pelotomaculum sp.]